MQNEYFKREQEILNSINKLSSSFKFSKKHWENNLTELEFLSKEQKQGIEYLNKNKVAMRKNIEKDIIHLLQEFSPSKTSRDAAGGSNSQNNSGQNGNGGNGLMNNHNNPNNLNNISSNDPLLSDRDFNNNDKIKKHFSDFSSIISPIGDNKKFLFPYLKNKDESQIQLTKRSRDQSNVADLPSQLGEDDMMIFNKLKNNCSY